jgi:hypothetical protein
MSVAFKKNNFAFCEAVCEVIEYQTRGECCVYGMMLAFQRDEM